MSGSVARFASTSAALVLSAGIALITSGGSPLPGGVDVRRDVLERSVRARVREAERLHGPNSPELAATLASLARSLEEQPAQNVSLGVELARRVLEITESFRGPEDDEVAGALEGLALWLWYAGDFEGERKSVERALAIRESAVPPDDLLIVRNLHYLAEIDRVEGDYGRALQLRERIGPLLERAYGPDHEEVAVHLYYLAIIQAAIGDREAAVANASRAVAIRERVLQPVDPQLARSLNLLGSLLVEAGDLGRAAPALLRALSIWESTGSSGGADSALALANLGRLFVARGDDSGASSVFRRVLKIRTGTFGSNHPLVAGTLTELGAVQRRLGETSSSRVSLRRAIEMQRPPMVAPLPGLASSIRELAMLDWSEGATAALQGALEAERLEREHFRATSVGLSEREALAKSRVRGGGLDIAWAWASALVARGALDENVASDLLDETIRSRALVLDTLAARQRILALHPDAETAARVESVRHARRRLTYLLMEGPAPQPAEALPGLLKAAQADADRAERTLAEKSREYRKELARGVPGLEEVREALPPDSALVSYVRYDFAGDGPSAEAREGYTASVLVAGPDSPRIVSLGRAEEIDRAVRAWGERVSQDPRLRGLAESEAEYLGAARRLAERIWDPIVPLLGGVKHVFVVPDGALQGVNFATLVARSGEYLVGSDVSIQYLTAERDLAAAQALPVPGHGLLALGDPAYGVPVGAGVWRFDPLPSSRQEVLDVASQWPRREPAKVLTGEEAGETAFRRLAPSYRVLHVATHAFFESGTRPGESPLRVAGLALAGANRISSSEASTEAEDGILTAEEIALLDLRGIEWAVLSACASGQGRLEPGEGILGLRRAFQIAGVRTLIVSLWPVEDDATRHWMRALYASRRAGASTVDAVRAASRGLLEAQRRAGGTTHPYFWGSFVSVGDRR